MIKKSLNRIKGSLYGVAVGDSLGAPVEFMSAEEIKHRHGQVRDMMPGGWLNVHPGEVTDDTQMTLAVADGIIADPVCPIREIGNRFIAWADGRPKDIGGTCAMSINNAKMLLKAGVDSESAWKKAGIQTAQYNHGRSGGNGALMRTVYTGLYYNDRDVIDKTADIAEMTHADDISTSLCVQYSVIIQKFIQMRDKVGNDMFYAIYTDTKCDDQRAPTGWSMDSFRCAAYSINNYNGFEKSLIAAVNLGGDADTIGAITGGLAGSMYGFDAIPTRWIEQLDRDVRDKLDYLAAAAFAHC